MNASYLQQAHKLIEHLLKMLHPSWTLFFQVEEFDRIRDDAPNGTEIAARIVESMAAGPTDLRVTATAIRSLSKTKRGSGGRNGYTLPADFDRSEVEDLMEKARAIRGAAAVARIAIDLPVVPPPPPADVQAFPFRRVEAGPPAFIPPPLGYAPIAAVKSEPVKSTGGAAGARENFSLNVAADVHAVAGVEAPLTSGWLPPQLLGAGSPDLLAAHLDDDPLLETFLPQYMTMFDALGTDDDLFGEDDPAFLNSLNSDVLLGLGADDSEPFPVPRVDWVPPLRALPGEREEAMVDPAPAIDVDRELEAWRLSEADLQW